MTESPSDDELTVDLGDQAFTGTRMLCLYWTPDGPALALWGKGRFDLVVHAVLASAEPGPLQRSWQRMFLGTAVCVGRDDMPTTTLTVPEHIASLLRRHQLGKLTIVSIGD